MKNNVIKRTTTNIKAIDKRTNQVIYFYKEDDKWLSERNGKVYSHFISFLRDIELYEFVCQYEVEAIKTLRNEIDNVKTEIRNNEIAKTIDIKLYDRVFELKKQINEIARNEAIRMEMVDKAA